jgi:hypothetical protein
MFFNFGMVPSRDAKRRALSRSMRALSASRISRFLRHPGELLGDAYEIVIKRNIVLIAVSS